MLLILLVWALVQRLQPFFVRAIPESVRMTIHNHAGAAIEIFWVNLNTPTRELVLQSETPIRNGTSVLINSYNTHEFVIKFHKDHGHLHHVQGHFIKGPYDEDVDILFDPHHHEFQIVQTNDYDRWVTKIHNSTQKCMKMPSSKFSTCIADDVYKEVGAITEEKETMVRYRDLMSERLRNYTCADPHLESSEPLERFEFNFDGASYEVGVLLDLPRAKIWYVKDFINEAECQKFRELSHGNLQRATVAAADGTSVVSEHRRAQQAHYSLPDENPENDLLWPLYHRATSFMNTYGKTEVEHAGQEGFTIIQYNPSDEYTPRRKSSISLTHNAYHF